MRLSLLLCGLLTALTVSSQTPRPWEQLLAETMTADDMESAAWDDTYQMLCELEQQPLNLNTATREQLEALPFLTGQQVEAIMEYRYRYGSLKSLNELRMIRPLDFIQIELLPYFTVVSEEQTRVFPHLDSIMKHGRHELMADVRVPLYKRQGDRNGYLGYPYRHWTRYQFRYGDYVKAGLVGAQDAGEPFFAAGNSLGYDFYSYYLQVKKWGRIDNIVIGQYKLSTGMGLVLNNSFGMGKLATLQQLGRTAATVRPHSSRSPTGYFRGIAATISLSDHCRLTAFASHRPLDATLNADGSMSTIVDDGYHRTPTEMQKKHNSHAIDAGAHVAWRLGGLHLGATALYSHLDRPLRPKTSTLYRRHYAQGSDFMNLSADYAYHHPRVVLSGETAVDRHGAIATINSASMNVADGLSVMLLQRFYSYRYAALYARSLAEGGRVQNESALYAALTWQPSPSLRLQAYTDYAYFAWARYQVSQSSRAWDNLVTATVSRSRWTLNARYRLHLRQRDDADKLRLVNITEHRARLALSWGSDGPLSTTTQADGVITGGGQREQGYMLSQQATAQWQRLRLSATLGYFHTDSYASRLYVYERSPLYTFAFPAYYGHGLRVALMAQATLAARLTLTAKAGCTRYLDRTTIGSALQQINGKSQTDIDLQVRWKF